MGCIFANPTTSAHTSRIRANSGARPRRRGFASAWTGVCVCSDGGLNLRGRRHASTSQTYHAVNFPLYFLQADAIVARSHGRSSGHHLCPRPRLCPFVLVQLHNNLGPTCPLLHPLEQRQLEIQKSHFYCIDKANTYIIQP
jgi:hypothetical protein